MSAAGISAPPSWDLTRILLAVVALGGLIAASFLVLRPFLPAAVWATIGDTPCEPHSACSSLSR